jgi:hypothetical protein
MAPAFIFFIIKLLLIILLALWCSIGISLLYRKYRKRRLNIIEKTFAETVAKYLYPVPGQELSPVEIQRIFKKVGIVPYKKGNVQYLIDIMIRTQRSLLGSNYVKLERFYTMIPPYRVSLNKLKSKKWYVKARGIREIYEMGQVQYLREVLKEIDNKNIFIRREAQIALIVFLGWESLRFLPYLKREMTLWQQIKIVEKLYDLYPKPEIKYLKRAYKSDKPYAQELIMRIIRKFHLTEEVSFIIKFLDVGKFDKREAAIYCITSFQLNDRQLNQVKNKFLNITNTEQKAQLLKYITRISSSIDVDFYKILLATGDDVIKLSAAEILWNNGYKEVVQEFYYKQYVNEPVNIHIA